MRELKELGETMAERGLRLKADLDETLESWEGTAAPLASSPPRAEEIDDVGDEDIEHRAEEIRRLRPY